MDASQHNEQVADRSVSEPPARVLHHWTCALGTYWIIADPIDPKQFVLGRNGRIFLRCSSAEACALALHDHQTSDADWDATTLSAPTSLEGWLHRRTRD